MKYVDIHFDKAKFIEKDKKVKNENQDQNRKHINDERLLKNLKL